MQISTSQEIYDSLVEKNSTPERILEVMMKRGDRHREYYEKAIERFDKLEAEYLALLRSVGRLVSVKVDHIAHDTWGSYTWYKYKKYRYDRQKGLWKKCNPNSNSPHYNAKHHHGTFKVNILLEEEDMPETFIGVCKGSVLGKKVILAEGHMIGYDDEFLMHKKEKIDG